MAANKKRDDMAADILLDGEPDPPANAPTIQIKPGKKLKRPKARQPKPSK